MRLSSSLLLAAYCQGVFPMAHQDGEISWYDPDPRAVLPIHDFRVPRRLKRALRNNPFDIRYDTAFDAVIRACAEPAPKREQTWISEEIIEAYVELHEIGYAHCVEAWRGHELKGGLYGVAIGGLFAGESMFSRASNASNAALVSLVRRLRETGFCLLDVQFMTEHLRRFGAIEFPRAQYKRLLTVALRTQSSFSSEAPSQHLSAEQFCDAHQLRSTTSRLDRG